MTKISILGCGWLGFPLAKALVEKGFLVNGSTTTVAKMSRLEQEGIVPCLVALDSKSVSGEIAAFLQDSQTLIIDIPPKLRGNTKSILASEEMEFVAKIKNLIPFIATSTVENVLFISSTSVYSDGISTVLHINEETPLNPDTESGRQLAFVEALLQKNTNFKTTIVRFGGLIGEDRNPVTFLSGREHIENAEAPINLIHQVDCIGIITTIISDACWDQTFNAVTPHHPSRKEYYTQKALSLQLALPKFAPADSCSGKQISSDKIRSLLNYTFIKTNL
jgi:nucleoside-diphosphate-sugar epimerase